LVLAVAVVLEEQVVLEQALQEAMVEMVRHPLFLELQ
jgi:hypothetical protein